MKIKNLVRNASKPGYGKVMVGKVISRLEPGAFTPSTIASEWYEQNAVDLESTSLRTDRDLLKHAICASNDLAEWGKAKLAEVNVELGGGAVSALLYYAVRKLRPDIVVETGVAAGYSSNTLLTAIRENGKGQLFSSDFPYFRLENPEQYIGIVVKPELKANWTLLTKGDENNLPEILNRLEGRQIDLFHYDSDKSYHGRERALAIVAPALKDDSLIIFDDIVDNSHFYDWITSNNFRFRIIRFGAKLNGVTTRRSPLIDGLF